MRDRKAIILLILIMATVSLLAAGIAISLLYRAAIAEERARLVETVQSQARLIEAVVRWEEVEAVRNPDEPGHGLADVMSILADAHAHYEGFGETGEFTLARRDGPDMIFLLSHRHGDRGSPKPVPFDSDLAEPMRRSLSGLSGTVVGPDYRGVIVLAAHEPVAELDWGIVAKIDLAEVRAPFLRAGLITGCAGFIVVLVGAVLFIRVSNPLVRRLIESEARIRAIVQTAAEGIMTIDDRGIIESFNTAATRIFGYNAEEVIGRDVRTLMPPAPDGEQGSFAADCNSSGGAGSIFREAVGRRKDGRIFPIDLGISEVRQVNRKFVTAIVRDITHRRQAEEALLREKRKLDDVTGHANCGLLLLDEQARVTYANRLLQAWFGSLEDIRGKYCWEVFEIEDPEKDCAGLEVLRTKQTVEGHSFARRVDGLERVYYVVASPVKDDHGRIQQITEVVVDVTERVRAEEAARAAQEGLLEHQRQEKQHIEAELEKARGKLVSQARLAAIGQVSASIGHELRNPLGAVRNSVYLLRRLSPDAEAKRTEYLDIIDQEVNRANRTIGDLMEMSRPKGPCKEDVDLAEVVRNACNRASLPAGIRVRFSPQPDPFIVRADPGQMRQVIGNLLTNAVQSMEGRGSISIGAARKDGYDTILVEDDGPGVLPEHRKRLFEPLFSTKVKGTGLGLTICRQIIEKHDGTIDLVEGRGDGAAIEIRLRGHVQRDTVEESGRRDDGNSAESCKAVGSDRR